MRLLAHAILISLARVVALRVEGGRDGERCRKSGSQIEPRGERGGGREEVESEKCACNATEPDKD